MMGECVLEVIGEPSIFKVIRSTTVLTEDVSVFVLFVIK